MTSVFHVILEARAERGGVKRWADVGEGWGAGLYDCLVRSTVVLFFVSLKGRASRVSYSETLFPVGYVLLETG